MANLVTGEAFLAWAAGVGVGFDPRYPDARHLVLLPPRESARFWVLPRDPGTWPYFAGSVLEGLDPWQAGYLWPRAGRWPSAADSSSYNEQVRDVLLRGAGVPDGWAGAIRFSRDELGTVLAILFAYLSFGWYSEDDLYFVPDHGRQVVQTDHHDVIHVRCADEDRIREFVTHMTAEEYELPTEPPDWTFKRPGWMGSAATDPVGE